MNEEENYQGVLRRTRQELASRYLQNTELPNADLVPARRRGSQLLLPRVSRLDRHDPRPSAIGDAPI